MSKEMTLDEANALLERPDVPIASHKEALLTKLAYEHRNALVVRLNAEADAASQRKIDEHEEKKRQHEERLKTDPQYRRECEARASKERWDKVLGSSTEHLRRLRSGGY
jgi:hypothetical protein